MIKPDRHNDSKKRLFFLSLGLIASIQFFPQAVVPAYAQEQNLPDWSGRWMVNYSPAAYTTEPTLTEVGKRQIAQYKQKRSMGTLPDSGAGIDCVPIGMPDIMASPLFLLEFYFTPEKIVAYLEAYGMVRWIFTDGRSRPNDPTPAYMGYSIGHWEEDTLVVATSSIYQGTRMDIPDPEGGTPVPIKHSEEMRLEERIRLIDENTLEIQTTVSDPILFSTPGVMRYTFDRHLEEGWDVAEYVCQQNNRAFLDEDGKQHSILTND